MYKGTEKLFFHSEHQFINQEKVHNQICHLSSVMSFCHIQGKFSLQSLYQTQQMHLPLCKY